MNADRVDRSEPSDVTDDGAHRGFHAVGDGEDATVDASAWSPAPAIARRYSLAPAQP